jgi:IS5 family transposase
MYRSTRRSQFPTEMDRVMPPATLEEIVTLHYPTAGRARRPLPPAKLLRMYLIQQWFNLSNTRAAV